MEETSQKKRTVEWQHIQQQIKNYKNNYQGRPIPIKDVSTFLNFTQFLAQLSSTYSIHYAETLPVIQLSTLLQTTQQLMEDLLEKFKSLSFKLERKQVSDDVLSRAPFDVCKICTNHLKEVQVKSARASVQKEGKGMTHNILKLIKEIQADGKEPTFTQDEDRRFYKELKKKQEVLEICNSEIREYGSIIESHLAQFVNVKEHHLTQQKYRQPFKVDLNFGEDIKQAMNKSIQEQFKIRFPVWINKVLVEMKAKDIKERRQILRDCFTQTQVTDQPKMTELRKKIGQLEGNLAHCNQEKDKLSWKIQQRNIRIKKLQQQAEQVKQMLNTKTYETQRQTKYLEDKNKRLRQQLQKSKEKQQRFERQLAGSSATIRQMELAHREKERDKNHFEVILKDEVEDTLRNRKKKSLRSTAKGSAKCFLPTLSKIGRAYEGSKTELYEENDRSGQLQNNITVPHQQRQQIKNNIDSIGLEDNKSANLVGKKQKKLLSISSKKQNKKGQKQQQELSNNNVFTERQKSNKGLSSQNSKIRKGYKEEKAGSSMRRERLTDVQQLKKIGKRSSQEKQIMQRIENFRQKGEGLKVSIEMRQDVRSVKQELEQRSRERIGQTTISSRFRSTQKTSIYEHQQREGQGQGEQRESNFLTETNPNRKFTQDDKMKENANNSSKNLNNPTILEQLGNQLRSGAKARTYLQNTFNQISEDVQKQNYITPAIIHSSARHSQVMAHIASQRNSNLTNTRGLKEKGDKKGLRQHLEMLFQKLEGEQLPSNIRFEEFNSLFINCLQMMKENHNLGKQSIFKPKKQNKMDKKKIITEPAEAMTNQTTQFDKQDKDKIQVSKEKRNEISKQKSVEKQKNQKLKSNKQQNKIIQDNSISKINKKLIKNEQNSKIDQKIINQISKQGKSQDLIQKLRLERERLLILGEKSLSGQRSLKSCDKSIDDVARSSKVSKHVKCCQQFDFQLFLNDEMAYGYEMSFSRKFFRNGQHNLNEGEEKYLQSLFALLGALRIYKNDIYQKISSYLRYPFMASQNGNLQVDLIQNISFPFFRSCFQRIFWYHRKCKRESIICDHVQKFANKLNQLNH